MTLDQLHDQYHAIRVECSLKGEPMVLHLSTRNGSGDIHDVKGGVFGTFLADEVYLDGKLYKSR
jgi:hypothetical protein